MAGGKKEGVPPPIYIVEKAEKSKRRRSSARWRLMASSHLGAIVESDAWSGAEL